MFSWSESYPWPASTSLHLGTACSPTSRKHFATRSIWSSSLSEDEDNENEDNEDYEMELEENFEDNGRVINIPGREGAREQVLCRHTSALARA